MEDAPVVVGVRTAADRDKAARAGAIELGDDDAGDAGAGAGEAPCAPRKRRRVGLPPVLTTLPTPKPADRAELMQLRRQLAARRPSMIYKLQGVALEEPIPHPEGLPPLLDQFSRVRAAVGELRRQGFWHFGRGRDPMKELLLLRQCALRGPAQTVVAVAADVYGSMRARAPAVPWC